jgi:hypothetical protein
MQPSGTSLAGSGYLSWTGKCLETLKQRVMAFLPSTRNNLKFQKEVKQQNVDTIFITDRVKSLSILSLLFLTKVTLQFEKDARIEDNRGRDL